MNVARHRLCTALHQTYKQSSIPRSVLTRNGNGYPSPLSHNQSNLSFCSSLLFTRLCSGFASVNKCVIKPLVLSHSIKTIDRTLLHNPQMKTTCVRNICSSKFVRSNQSALSVKRIRKKIPKIHDEGKTRQLNNVVAYALGEEISLQPLKNILTKQGLYAIGALPTDVNDALLVRGIYNVDQKPKEIFVFEDGSVVFWCVPEIERGSFLKLLMKYCEAPYPRSMMLTEREEMDFTYVKDQTGVKDDLIQLKERDLSETDNDHVLELYTFANAMSQSVKLSAWEASLDTFVISIETVTEDVRKGRKISMSRRQLLKKSGELMSLRYFINLSSDLLDTPDFYWDRSKLESLYQNLCGQLNIAKRTNVINKKLTHCLELVDLVRRHLSDEHHIRLEIMIIILIMVEVVFEVIHFVKDYYSSSPSSSSSSSPSSTSPSLSQSLSLAENERENMSNLSVDK